MENKTALVTGAAGGIGSAIVRALGEQGATVAAVDRDEERLREEVDLLTGKGLRVHAFLADVTDSESVECVVDAIERRLGPVDYLVNAAGVLRLGAAWELSEQDWETVLGVNTTGVFHMSRYVVDRMIPRSSGSMVTIVSNAAGTARTGMAAYSASKAAAAMFTKCLGLEVARYGIRCNLVAPGSTNTPMLASMWHDETGPERTLDGSSAEYRVGIPLRKLAEPEDIADAVLFLLSDQAAHITMHTVTVDGGATLGV
ncbi:2,3-dihydro-2,3-dihydroxybenzoate dehydrogenase [Nocardia pseudobrasiliensis]|uniref:2,3-dihydro-2,3-dihydroxybenzoate dehydrogenase n=1 Tax=Nocardia pseudobrasiliensis TaxID=45979 RepID=A0A370IEA4_9NOCA|nr:2,3-dihydro-2,3-dihydroxybenzoate dehydrogenase [Nocardia pseudobrasiliensis]RDI69048.1 2,3-dihydro-2,3-dihydroxybenzoate dehydrogenase [Nocardia pseudobrasiliensis]